MISAMNGHFDDSREEKNETLGTKEQIMNIYKGNINAWYLNRSVLSVSSGNLNALFNFSLLSSICFRSGSKVGKLS